MARIILWRHGQTDYNFGKRIQGQVDIPLNDVGLEQAHIAARHLCELAPTHIVSSDLIRARETADTLAALTGLEVTLDTRLRERNYGPWEGRTGDEISAQWPDQHLMWRNGQEPGLGVESRLDSGTRNVAAIHDHVARVSESGDYTLVVVGHGGALSNAAMSLIGFNPSEQQPLGGMDNCHWAILTPQTNRKPGWCIRGYNLFG